MAGHVALGRAVVRKQQAGRTYGDDEELGICRLGGQAGELFVCLFIYTTVHVVYFYIQQYIYIFVFGAIPGGGCSKYSCSIS